MKKIIILLVAAATLITVSCKKHEHEFVKHDAVPATYTEAGAKEYYECVGTVLPCGNFFEDALGQVLIGGPTELAAWVAEGGAGYVPVLTTLSYGGVDYKVAVMADGNVWMAENLRYVPAGLTPCSDLNNVTAGVYCPVKVNGGTESQAGTAVFATDEETIKAQGYLYQAETALGVAVNSIDSEENAKKLEGCQGICPEGWHIPTIEEIRNLVGKAVSPIEKNPEAPYYDGTNGSIKLLNEDGFNVSACGAVTIQDNTKTVATLMGALKGFPDKVTSGFICGSSYAGISYNTSGEPTSGIKNVQFFGLQLQQNKADEASWTCNGTKISYKIGASVRCVKNADPVK